MRTAAVVLALLALVPAALGQAHDHAGAASVGTRLQVDVQDDVQAGDLARFSAIVFGDDAVPDAHQDLHLQVLFDGRPLLETTSASGHDYDGTSQFDVTFPTPGPYVARVLDEGGAEVARLDGWVMPSDAQPATARLEGPGVAEVGQAVPFRVWPEDATGELVRHFYTLLEVRDGPTVVYRAKMHGHGGGDDGPAEALLGFPAPGIYTVEATLFQGTPAGTQHLAYRPLHAERTVQVLPGPPGVPLAPAPVTNGPVTVDGVGIRLTGTFDPASAVGPGTLQHLSILAQTPHGEAMRHTDYAVQLTGPLGQTLFASDFMHESDGVLEFATTQPMPGAYTFTVQNADRATIALPYNVVARMGAPAGPQQVAVTGLDGAKAGVAQDIEVAIADLAGRPLEHSEVDVQVVGPAGVPILTTKLHAHGDGRFPLTFTPLEPGPHRLRLVPFTLEAKPVVFLDAAGWSDLPFDVAAGEGWATVPKPGPAASSGVDRGIDVGAPLLAALATLAIGLAGATVFALRRRFR